RLATERLGLALAQPADVELEEEAQERFALGRGDPGPDVLERPHLRFEQARLAPADLGEHLVDQALLRVEVVEKHPGAGTERLRQRALWGGWRGAPSRGAAGSPGRPLAGGGSGRPPQNRRRGGWGRRVWPLVIR